MAHTIHFHTFPFIRQTTPLKQWKLLPLFRKVFRYTWKKNYVKGADDMSTAEPVYPCSLRPSGCVWVFSCRWKWLLLFECCEFDGGVCLKSKNRQILKYNIYLDWRWSSKIRSHVLEQSMITRAVEKDVIGTYTPDIKAPLSTHLLLKTGVMQATRTPVRRRWAAAPAPRRTNRSVCGSAGSRGCAGCCSAGSRHGRPIRRAAFSWTWPAARRWRCASRSRWRVRLRPSAKVSTSVCTSIDLFKYVLNYSPLNINIVTFSFANP